MKTFLPKILSTFLTLLLIQHFGKACDISSFIAPERVCLDKVGNYRGNGIKEPGCGTDTKQYFEVISGPGNATIEYTNEDQNEARISFDAVGIYTIRYFFEDEASCGTDVCFADQQTEVFYPSARFAEESISVCEGGTVSADIIFTNASNVSVQGQGLLSISSNEQGMATYSTTTQVFESFVLKIVTAREGTCANETLHDSLVVNVLKEPKLTAIDTICNQTNELYNAVFEISGGDGTYSLLTPGIGSIEGNIFTTIQIEEGTSFDYTINSGPTCGEFSGSASATCECNLTSGFMGVEPIQACEADVIEVMHNTQNLDKRSTDSIIYVLHNSDQAEIGARLALSYEPRFALPSPELADSQLYVSAVVGPFTLENFNINEIECKSVNVGTPVRWFSKDEFDISGKLEVCAGDKNRTYVANVDEELKRDRDRLFWYSSEGSGIVIESQSSDRSFVSFPTASSSGKIYYQVDRELGDRTCSSIDSIEVVVDGSETAPPESEIILWPGDFFASTSEGPCYQWGYVDRFANFAITLVGTNDKFFFSDESIGQGTLTDRAYFVAIYDTPNCEFSLDNCNSIVFFNQKILDGLSVGVEDDFEVGVAPNPNDGNMRLEINGSFKGEYNLELFSDVGQRVHQQKINKFFPKSISDLTFEDIPRGIYFLRLTNEIGDYQVLRVAITK